ncbi:LOW QUALITY PROTEIN: hypothetical protein MAR_024113, partial [Mya arenaria]
HIYKDRRATVRSIGDDLDISSSTVYCILTDKLGVSKVSARWVPSNIGSQTVEQSMLIIIQRFLRRDRIQAFRKKRLNADHDRIILHQDNAAAHKAASTQLEIGLLGFELLVHPPYSPVSTSDLMQTTQRIISTLDKESYVETFTIWISRHRKCVNTDGDYVKKNNKELKLCRQLMSTTSTITSIAKVIIQFREVLEQTSHLTYASRDQNQP